MNDALGVFAAIMVVAVLAALFGAMVGIGVERLFGFIPSGAGAPIGGGVAGIVALISGFRLSS